MRALGRLGLSKFRGDCMSAPSFFIRRPSPRLAASRLSLASLLAAPALLLAAAAPAQAQSAQIQIPQDGVQRIGLRGAAASVVVGNPRIADVTVIDTNTIVITGKGAGITEVMVLDAIGRPLLQNRIVVAAEQSGSVRLWRGAQATEMVCAESCSRASPAEAAASASLATTPPSSF